MEIIKKQTATTGLLWEYEVENESLPKPGEFNIILNAQEDPVCITQITDVEIIPFNQVSEQHAFNEGDRSLEYWRKVHWNFFMKYIPVGKNISECMPMICITFKKVSV